MTVKHEQSQAFGSKGADGGAQTDVASEGRVSGARQIQSVARALDIVEVLASEHEGLALSDLADRLGLNASTCHHLISTLVARGYVERLGRSRGYVIGRKVRELVELEDSLYGPEVLLKRDLRDLGEKLGLTVQLAIMAETSLLTKLRFASADVVDSFLEPDEITKMTALHATATGKAILAWLPEVELVRVISANGLTRYTDKTITSLAGLIEELRLVRRRGYSIDDEELKSGVVCLGAALRDGGGAIVGSISASGPAEHLTGDYRGTVARKMAEAGVEFSRRLRAAKQ
ncbi:IclR family transcriptional regulator [Octadecabacter sp. R77987]|uniref:IclR family transcriptional regulator n=1 Tax=Octadecabacter sp. R77987 TaxID=3093874 RepID=UPI00366A9FA3